VGRIVTQHRDPDGRYARSPAQAHLDLLAAAFTEAQRKPLPFHLDSLGGRRASRSFMTERERQQLWREKTQHLENQ
jgi:hypothetical protein